MLELVIATNGLGSVHQKEIIELMFCLGKLDSIEHF